MFYIVLKKSQKQIKFEPDLISIKRIKELQSEVPVSGLNEKEIEMIIKSLARLQEYHHNEESSKEINSNRRHHPVIMKPIKCGPAIVHDDDAFIIAMNMDQINERMPALA